MTASPTLDRILVLNVKKFDQRRSFMEQQLIEFGLSAEFIFDWDIEDLSDDVIADYFGDNPLTAAQQSCALKHVAALQKIAANQGQGLSLVLEDDAVFGKDLKLGLQRALEQSLQFPGDKVIYIGSGGNFFTPKSQRKPGQYLYPGHRGRFADSYLIDAHTARKRLEWIKIQKINEPIDNQFEKIDKQLGIQILWLEDPVIEQGSKNGLFQSALEADPPTWLKAIFFRWEKLKRKYIYQLWR
ncbi:glycosyltransferase family 25 protein [Methylomonas montana]|uniref:glycosyltransferase family 25 protein n=1 Tax=Methylomonas montana TaxID=3058963 RepID=UPI002658E01B|nr:glycosyltransferase family 25 protein [Methylomonas montana]WKJ91082.1 glycosyltransferase family 25 protein [Methylomonas montana]